MRTTTLVRGIGWTSLGLALAAFATPELLGRALGLGERRALVRALGSRDLVLGVGLVTARDPSPWMRARLASDAGDALLHAAGALTGRFARGRSAAVALSAAALAAVDLALIADLRRRPAREP